ncbi:MAG: aryl-sulfate sulfotransferase, partial [Planctomycetota bacterium]
MRRLPNQFIVVLIAATALFGPLRPVSAQSGSVLTNTDKAFPGYTLIAPLGSTETQLIDLKGDVVHRWQSEVRPGNSVYLLEDGSLLRTGKVTDSRVFALGGGSGGLVQRFSWDGELVWDYRYASDTHFQHHDIEPMPNGNVLMIAWEKKTQAEAIAAGRDPAKIGTERRGGGTEPMLWPESIVEIQPDGKTGGKVVWKWSLWDHLVQDFDKTKANYGDPSKHPELVDLNFVRSSNPDWIHMNSVAYNAELDQIIVSARWFHEVWIIDHSTTTAEAASHEGGDSGKGGDLLYRWGNPYTYWAGFPDEQQLFGQHDAHWIPQGCPGAGNLMVFNNGSARDGRSYSTVDEWSPPKQ